MDAAKQLSDVIKALDKERERKGIAKWALCKQAGYSKSAWSNAVRTGTISCEMLFSICDCLNVEILMITENDEKLL